MMGIIAGQVSCNDIYYSTNLNVAKKFAKDILGTLCGAPYIFMDMVWVPLETYNRNTLIYMALHHFGQVIFINHKAMRIKFVKS
ncbi:hypothetical protein [Lysinibacillus sp. 2017]|uniref:hypothetical protein n=1 Tax=Lysinibacillus sp. 2017 TaxID=2169540 RepID=UPI00131F1B9B|nr:hypothetical protein [Lysinibacillus sp. 2017]